jgi:hypothetical protein
VRLEYAEFCVLQKYLYPFTMQRRQFIIAENVAELMRFGKPRAEQRNVVNLLVLA